MRRDEGVGQGTPGRRGTWILVVHGSAVHARPIETLLEEAGYEVASASEVDEAQMLLRTGRPDLVIASGGQGALVAEQLSGQITRPIVTVGGAATAPQKQHSLTTLLQIVAEQLALPVRCPGFEGNEGDKK